MKKALAAILLLIGATANAAVQKITIKTPDGAALPALYSKPAGDRPTVIMLHGLASVKEEWQPLIDYLVPKGFGVLAYDARKAGTPWQKLVDDVGAAVRTLEANGGDRKKIVLAGASLGANVCLKYAALTGNGSAVLLLSPGLNYQGLTSDDAIRKVSKSILIVASSVDGYAYQSSNALAQISKNAHFLTSQKPGHGVQMFDPWLLEQITSWLAKQK